MFALLEPSAGLPGVPCFGLLFVGLEGPGCCGLFPLKVDQGTARSGHNPSFFAFGVWPPQCPLMFGVLGWPPSMSPVSCGGFVQGITLLWP